LIQRLEAQLRDLKELFIQQKGKISNKFDVPHSPLEGKPEGEGKGCEGAVEGAEEVVVDSAELVGEQGVVDGAEPVGEEGAIESA